MCTFTKKKMPVLSIKHPPAPPWQIFICLLCCESYTFLPLLFAWQTSWPVHVGTRAPVRVKCPKCPFSLLPPLSLYCHLHVGSTCQITLTSGRYPCRGLSHHWRVAVRLHIDKAWSSVPAWSGQRAATIADGRGNAPSSGAPVSSERRAGGHGERSRQCSLGVALGGALATATALPL
jgi:hypothetical protein